MCHKLSRIVSDFGKFFCQTTYLNKCPFLYSNRSEDDHQEQLRGSRTLLQTIARTKARLEKVRLETEIRVTFSSTFYTSNFRTKVLYTTN